MHDAELVGHRERLARLNDVVDGFPNLERSLSLRHDLLEVRALQVLHHDVRRSRFEPVHVDDAHHMLPAELNAGARLLDEPIDDIGPSRGSRAKVLDRHPVPEPQVTRGHHDTHGALAHHLFDLILAREQAPLAEDAVLSVLVPNV